VVDVGWAAGLGVAAVLYGILADGDPSHRMLVAAVAGIWSARLALYVFFDRVYGKPEDGRYQTLRAKWGASAPWKSFVFFQVQGLLDVILSLPSTMIPACLSGSTSGS